MKSQAICDSPTKDSRDQECWGRWNLLVHNWCLHSVLSNVCNNIQKPLLPQYISRKNDQTPEWQDIGKKRNCSKNIELKWKRENAIGIVYTYLNIVGGIKSETMVNPSRQNNEITSVDVDSNPTVILIPHIKVATPLQTITYLLITMNVLCVEILQLLLIVFHFLRAQIQQILMKNYIYIF